MQYRRDTTEPPDEPRARLEQDDTVPAARDGSAERADPLAATDASPARAHETVAVTDLPGRFGRFTMLQRIGMGGMGVVYMAHDGTLDRKVALKLLHPHQSATESALRIIREAQAMARLIHPNVVAVHDVGMMDGAVFLAMDYIEGQTLRAWHRQPRTWRRTVEVYCEAGQGLLAAHEAGLVHRDFKPDNVLIGVDGRARVLDFGLARAAGVKREGEDAVTRESAQAARRSSALESPLTESGAIVGTPAYMAPEQWLGQDADALSDQFSFCVSLYEQLYAQRAFAGSTAAALSDNVIHGRLVEPPAAGGVPRWVFKALRRGLSPSPAARWPSMRALLGEFERGLARRRNWSLAAVPATAAISVGLYALLAGKPEREAAVCREPALLLAGVWDDEVRSVVARSLKSAAAPYAEDTARRVEKLLDRYASELADMYAESCDRTYVRGDQPIRTHELTSECLDERRDELKALVQVLGAPEQAAVGNAIEAVSHLSPLRECVNPGALVERHEFRTDASRAATVRQLRARLAEVKSLDATGRHQEGIERVDEVLAEARALDFPRLEAEALYHKGHLLESRGEYKEAEKLMSDAFFAAEASQASLLAISAAGALVRICQMQSDISKGLVWARHGEAVIRRTGAGTPEHAELLNSVGIVHVAQGRYDDAQVAFEGALGIWQDVPDAERLNVSRVLINLSNLCVRQGRFVDAEEYLLRAHDVFVKTLGPEHPDVAIVDNNLGEVYLAQDKLGPAQECYERALALMSKTIGETHPNTGVPLTNLGIVHQRLGHYELSRQHLTRAMAIFQRLLGDEHVFLSYPLTGLGELGIAEGRFDEALRDLERALKLREDSSAPTEEIAQTQFALARASWAFVPRRAQALELARAAELRYRSAGAGHARRLAEVQGWLAERASAAQ